MKEIHFLCHDEQCTDNGALPLIAVFTVNDIIETEDVIDSFTKTFTDLIPGSEDCSAIGYAVEAVCNEYGASVEFIEVDQEFGRTRNDVCQQCGRVVSDAAMEGLYCINMDFYDE